MDRLRALDVCSRARRLKSQRKKPPVGVTIKSAPHKARIVSVTRGAATATEVLDEIDFDANDGEPKGHGELLQSSLDEEIPPVLLAQRNGFVKAVTTAYNTHHNLVVGPEGVWTAILTQFSAYVNAHAEELRGLFVAHEGRKELEVVFGGSRHTVDFAVFAKKIADLIEQNVVDPELREWMTPAFSTTTDHHVVVASIVMMGTLQSYFAYMRTSCCGIPSVTLLGEKADYELMFKRLEKLENYGEEPKAFAALLRPVLYSMARSFDDPQAPEVIDFWQRAAAYEAMGSGQAVYEGWITAFKFWNAEGKCLNYHVGRKGVFKENAPHDTTSMDDLRYHALDVEKLTLAYVKVPVLINDNGCKIKAEMLAGSVGISCTSSGEVTEDKLVGLDTMQPQLGWFMYEL